MRERGGVSLRVAMMGQKVDVAGLSRCRGSLGWLDDIERLDLQSDSKGISKS